ncbi:MotE family protein [Hydrogenothermus marinus]|uniref:Flagellar motility protein MotE (MotC chaperone) n=1 Tax=Hydrogenothermus marinus TaxID=133270 RepID=A0A3M0BK87_9AQUI|nr:hypothetical protein [Hydrogenothermus marinus]RMA97631.1 hypothetical protein CLV39_0251 [Hydrogenothermus marinus]
MRFLIVSLFINIFIFGVSYSQPEKKEIDKEIKKLEKLRTEVQNLIKRNEEILKKIEEEKSKLEKERKEFEKYVKEVEDERYKKLAKVFEKMEPELAGQKISNMEDPKKAAYIIFNMKERSAGEVLNYVSPDMVNQITKILTDIKKNAK